MDSIRTWTLSDLYREHYVPLVRMASLILGDVASAEEVVQDGFVEMHHSWARVTEEAKRPAYLRSIVLNGARARGRRRTIARRVERGVPANAPGPDVAVVQGENRREVMAALRTLPTRQRECLVLRYYEELSESEIAQALGISTGSVKTHTSRGMAALARALEKTR